ncbi:MAG: ABC transporter permease [Phycisphaerales bacterium]
MMRGSSAAIALGKRELIRQVRQPSRVVASVLTPMLVWVFFVGGFSSAIGQDNTDQNLTAYMIPGVASLTVMFSSIFASISLIQDRHDGVLRAALISPAPRWSIVAGKVGAGSIVAMIQGLVVLAALPFLGVELSMLGVLGACAGLGLISVALIGLGLGLAWIVDSSQGFHGIMNAVLMPMWLTSGAVFPINDAAGWLRTIAMVNPLSWAHSAVRGSLGMTPITGIPAGLDWLILVLFAFSSGALATVVMTRASRASTASRKSAGGTTA